MFLIVPIVPKVASYPPLLWNTLHNLLTSVLGYADDIVMSSPYRRYLKSVVYGKKIKLDCTLLAATGALEQPQHWPWSVLWMSFTLASNKTQLAINSW